MPPALFFEMVKIRAFSDAQLKTFAGQHIHAHSIDAILAPSLVYAYGVTKDLTIIAPRCPSSSAQDVREGHHSHGPARQHAWTSAATRPASAT